MNKPDRQHWEKVDQYGDILQRMAGEIAQEIDALWRKNASGEEIGETVDRLLLEKTQQALQEGIDLTNPALWELRNAYQLGRAKGPLDQDDLRFMINDILTAKLQFIQHGTESWIGRSIEQIRQRARRIMDDME